MVMVVLLALVVLVILEILKVGVSSDSKTANIRNILSTYYAHNQGCQIFRFLRKTSAFRLFFRIFSAVPHFSAFWKFFDTFSINRFQETIRNERIFFSKSMTLLCKVCKTMEKRSKWRFFYVEAKKDSTYQPWIL